MNLISNVLVLETPYDDHLRQQFKEAFDATWDRLTPKVQKTLYGYFKKNPGQVHLCYIMDYQSIRVEPWGQAYYYDKEQATLITFNAAVVQGAIPLEDVYGVIAHELAHCYRRGLSQWSSDEDVEESGVREVTRSWGFKEPAPDDIDAFMTKVDDWRLCHRDAYGKFTESYIVKMFGDDL